ncbi:MAG: prepilin peptidase, partial [Nitrospira sp. NTP1]|nr:prepilin peptidase [Nitrospira sp. NTP1]
MSVAECAELRGETPPLFEKLTLATPRSRCPHCGHRITAIENIPVLSYIFLRGRCRGCQARISPRYPLVEALSGLLSGYAAWRFGPSWAGIGALFFIWCM